ncbi:hypothetical protein AVEN_130728-1, partial [Araneus ventricosus]
MKRAHTRIMNYLSPGRHHLPMNETAKSDYLTDSSGSEGGTPSRDAPANNFNAQRTVTITKLLHG